MADPTWSLGAIAECIAGELTGSLRLQLFKALQQGQTLQTILQAAEGDSAALRAAVESFCGSTRASTKSRFARVATTAFKPRASARGCALQCADALTHAAATLPRS
jgi:hypothetical protein